MRLICGDRLRDICLLDGVIDAVDENIGFDAVDVRLGGLLRLEGNIGDNDKYNTVDLAYGLKLGLIEYDMVGGGVGSYNMGCGEFVLGELVEYIALPDWVIASFSLRSVYARNGLGHALSHWIKPGWSGKLVLELSNTLQHNGFVLRPNMVLGQIHFYDISDDL